MKGDAPLKPYSIGIDVGGTKVAYGLFSQDGSLMDRFQHPSNRNADGPAFTDTILETIHGILRKNSLSLSDLNGVGLCMPSHILFDEGFVYLTPALPLIRSFAMREYLQKRLDARIILDNDSNGAALAEYRRGAGRGCRHMVYIAMGTGIGSGLIIDGELFRGSYGWAGESGHMLVTPGEGELCGCENRGCIMAYASGRFVANRMQKDLQSGRSSILSKVENPDCEDLLKAYRQGDAYADEMISSMAHYIAICVYNLYQVLNINVFVFGGGLTNFGPVLFERIRSAFDAFDHIGLPVEFRLAQLDQDFGIIGAAELLR